MIDNQLENKTGEGVFLQLTGEEIRFAALQAPWDSTSDRAN